MKITHLLKVTLLGLMLSLLAGCQSAPKGLTPEQIAVLKEQGFYLTDEGGRWIWPTGCCLPTTWGRSIPRLANPLKNWVKHCLA